MFALARLVVVGFVLMTLVYIVLSLYSRSVRRRKLNEEWEEDPQGPREAFVEAGLEEYDSSLRRKLILGVYIVPTLVVALIIYLTNFA
ncbi:hypothetical protein E4Z66_14075 [Aliishimia ponticola]|uniref:Cation/multidrug efflux pump n=1 Tax=Aliishimia ponticola TaxID=2499833 RepID=A0A4S4NBX1_9RHOB|nr:hypothetical protein [Aliishimia ponticola]THH36175.1 hypothetical protein E4Z66_14075 [Aliishimia ponticola]